VELRLHSTKCDSGLVWFPVVKWVYVGFPLVFLPFSSSGRKFRLFAMHSGMHHEVNDHQLLIKVRFCAMHSRMYHEVNYLCSRILLGQWPLFEQNLLCLGIELNLQDLMEYSASPVLFSVHFSSVALWVNDLCIRFLWNQWPLFGTKTSFHSYLQYIPQN